jgi:hypothetical protein
VSTISAFRRMARPASRQVLAGAGRMSSGQPEPGYVCAGQAVPVPWAVSFDRKEEP